jgi:hypothetical protein
LGKEKSGNPGSHRKKVWGRLWTKNGV